MWQMEQWVSRNVCICTKEIATLDGAIIHFIRRNNLVYCSLPIPSIMEGDIAKAPRRSNVPCPAPSANVRTPE